MESCGGPVLQYYTLTGDAFLELWGAEGVVWWASAGTCQEESPVLQGM